MRRLNKGNNFIDRGAYEEQKCYDIGKYIITNKDKSFNELMDGLKNIEVSSKETLYRNIKKLEEYNLSLARAAKIVIEYKEKLEKGIIDTDLEAKFQRIGEIRVDKRNERSVHKKNHGYDHKNRNVKCDDEKINLSKKYANMIMSGCSKEELSKNFGVSVYTIEQYIAMYLPKVPEKFVEYKLHVYPVDNVICGKEVEQYKEVLEYFIKNLHLKLEQLEKIKENVYREKLEIKSLIKEYTKCLDVLNGKSIAMGNLSKIEDYIIEYCKNYRNYLILLKNLKSNYVYKDIQEQIYEICKKKIYRDE